MTTSTSAPASAPFGRAHTDDLLTFLAASPTPYHAVAEAARRLDEAGFRQVAEEAAWEGTPGGAYVLRGGALVAWYVPEGAEAHTPFRIVGAHTDSPGLRVKPQPDFSAHGFRQVAVELYGGPLLNSWLDRDLGLAGRLSLRDGSTKLLTADRPLLRVPQLAVHLDRGANDGLTLDRQRHLQPVWGLGEGHEGELIAFAEREAGLEEGSVTGWDLLAYPVEAPAYLGRENEFVAGPRMDNLLSVHSGVAALIAASRSGELSSIPVLAAFDHEETGSQSDTGADGPLLGNVLKRSVVSRGGSYEDRARALASSVSLSSDTGHAVHPNYAEKHDPTHHPRINGGPILKVNVNNRYATDGAGRSVFVAAAERAGTPYQSFVSNNSMPCGTTIGPITAARHGIKTVDIGVAILSMHSVRELCGDKDPYHLANTLVAFLEG
ncbi:M18 family aminopeptidase [Streptomyces sp. SPB074]|uniref:M18 family aminopeptidase n=1 Tax=Streptomyces sp. (strain SPB074) TaxID=465543 RepID=UPI00017F0E24|nr:M18 family aminopeptidase [Streptomyces sp. SPB074]EDY42858.1 M18 family peptidase [Streptomyces sp. SPB074]